MKKLLLIFLLASPCMASSMKRSFSDPALNDEFDNVYYRIDSVLKANPVRISTATISTATITNLNVTSINGVAFYNFQVSSQCTNGTTFTTTNSAFQTTNLTCAITPSSATSRIKITASSTIDSLSNTTTAVASIFRGATNLAGANGIAQASSDTGSSNVVPVSMIIIDSPATTSETTYSVKLLSTNGGSNVQFGAGSTQVMILEEIK